MKTILIGLLFLCCFQGYGQITKVSLQASGLTCSMCSKAVKNALESVEFVSKVQVDIKNQQYNISFKDKVTPDLDKLQAAVEDAGFSVASLKVTAEFSGSIEKDKHLEIGGLTFHFLNAAGTTLSGQTTFSVVDRKYVTAKEFKKYSAMSKMPCVLTGKAATCCHSGTERIYHAII